MNSYFEQRAGSYWKKSQSGIWGVVKKREMQTVENLLLPEKLSSLLDIGCGPGLYADYLSKKFQLSVTGIDSSPSMIKAARNNVPQADFHLKTLSEFSPDIHFDYALAIGLFEFVADPEESFLRISTLLKENGKLVILIPETGLSGLLYEWLHKKQGCPTFVRSADFYIRLGKKCGLIFKAEKRATPLSRAISFRKKTF